MVPIYIYKENKSTLPTCTKNNNPQIFTNPTKYTNSVSFGHQTHTFLLEHLGILDDSGAGSPGQHTKTQPGWFAGARSAASQAPA